MGFFAHNTGVLRPEKPKHRTSLHKSAVLLPRKFRCFAQRTPMFLPFQTPIFPAFCPIWGSFSGRYACKMPKFLFPKPNDLIYTYGKTSKFATFSALEAMPDTVKIFEDFRRFFNLAFPPHSGYRNGAVCNNSAHVPTTFSFSSRTRHTPPPCNMNGNTSVQHH